MAVNQNKKILIFSPFAYVWAHALPEIQLGRIFERNGYSVSLLSCERDFSQFCTSMSAAGIDVNSSEVTKASICEYCVKLRKISAKTPGIQFIESPDNGARDDGTLVPSSLEEKMNFTINGIEIGKIALYETLIRYKKTDLSFTKIEEAHYRISIENAMRSYHIAKMTIRSQKPDYLICYSPQYVIPGIFAAVAEKEGIPVIFAEGSAIDVQRYSHLRLWDWNMFGLSQPGIEKLSLFESYKPSARGLRIAKNQIASKKSSKTLSVYSGPKKGLNPFTFFELDESKKLYLMSMSSYDEVYSGHMIGKLPKERYQGTVFNDQIEWLKETIEWFSKNQDIQLIVRPHPREFPNKRDKQFSSHTNNWENVLRNLPPNVRVDHPSNGFSLFDHLKFIDVLITGWSSTGVEALAEGIPVVTYDENLPTFPRTIHLTGKSRFEYFSNLTVAAETGRSEKHRLNATRWVAYTAEVGTIKVGGRLSDRLRLKPHSLVARILNSRYFSDVVKRIEIRLPVTSRYDKKIIRLLNGGAKSLYEAHFKNELNA
jgi:hypothetical protein